MTTSFSAGENPVGPDPKSEHYHIHECEICHKTIECDLMYCRGHTRARCWDCRKKGKGD